MKKTVLVIATLDTKGREALYLKQELEKAGVGTLLMDTGTFEQSFLEPDIHGRDVARLAGLNLDEIVRKKDRSRAVEAMQEGGAIAAGRLLGEGKIDGVCGLGGGTGTAIVTAIMRGLPFGVPKVVVSTVASRDVREYVGTKDIVMFHSVADILGVNGFLRMILRQAAGAVAGMVRAPKGPDIAKPMIAVTAYGVSSLCAMNAGPLIESLGYEMMGFHANGVGGMAMEEMIAEGLIAGVLDFTSHEIADEMFGGYCRGITAARFETAGKMGVPLVFAPGGLDNAVFSPSYPMPEKLKGRRQHRHDIRFCVRMEREEMTAFAAIVAEKFNKTKGPVHILVPVKGWSEADKKGMELYDPAVNSVFVDELKRRLCKNIPIEEMDVHISDPAFAKRGVDIIDDMIRRR